MPATSTSRTTLVSLAVAAALVSAAGGAMLAQDEAAPDEPVVISYDFEADAQGWETIVADLPDGFDPEVGDLLFEWRPLPENLEGHGLYSQGANQSDSLFMGWHGRVDGLEPSTEYQIDAVITLASSIPAAWGGQPDSPAQAFVKLGGVDHPVETVVDDDGWLRLNALKGQGPEGGQDAIVLGNVANPNLGEEYADAQTFALMEMDTLVRSLVASSDAEGSMWLFMGTDSIYPGFTVLYYDQLDLTLAPQ